MVEPVDIEASLQDRSVYEAEILKMFSKRVRSGRIAADAAPGVSYYRAAADRRALASRIAKTIAAGEYRISPVALWFLERHGKVRPAHRPVFVDQVVGAVLFQLLTRNARAYGLPGVHSYLPGRSNLSAAIGFSNFIHRFRKQAGPRPPALHVLKSDFSKFGESLPMGPAAPLWKTMREVANLGNPRGDVNDQTWSLIVDLVRPVIKTPDGSSFTRTHGVSMGTPLTPLVSNLSVHEMDVYLNGVEGLFYARYNDDFILAHADLQTLKQVDADLEPILARLGVSRKMEKERRVALCGNGMPSTADPAYEGGASIDFLGISIAYNGGLSPAPHLQARFVKRICSRIDGLAAGFAGETSSDRAQILVSATNVMLDIENPFAAPGLATVLRVASNRGALKDMDFRIARKIVQAATGRAGNRGFRQIPPKRLREEMGLVSLVALRNLRR
ncbi:hypothetical protein K1W69_21765 [Hoeflea sp. WL0058]|uniref:Reverse transcriptase domain-containing protein n=1 Tax=Flavimaribacter sediminis TaxID=2865987 RepID=A0AAE2ZS17_9HYPH|nr:reverse transcriptase domain-containing protein [Flavimaribacter sediminis]MBW8639837.1 hypothetical protein [Flavimaribacter sediminis]